MKKRSRLIAEVFNNYWAIDPEMHSFMLDFLYGKIEPNLFLAKEFRDEEESNIEERLAMVGGTGIAYIPVFGTIYPRSTGMGEMCGAQETTIQGLRNTFMAALSDKDVKGIIFDHDSPGGAVTGVHGMAQDILAARGTKPIYSFTQGTCASADFWLYSASELRFADATARLGSVGTVVGVRKKDTKDSYVEVTNSLSPYKRLDIEDADHYKTLVKTLDDITSVFYDDLSAAFGLEKSFVTENFGKGGLKVGSDAQASKMFDEIGSFSDTIDCMISDISSGKRMVVDMAAKNNVDSFVTASVITKSSEDTTGGIMNILELKANHPELVAELTAEVSAASANKIGDLSATIAAKDAAIAALTEENSSLKKSVQEIEKEKLQASIAASVVLAHSIFDSVFAASSVPENFKAKVEKQISAESFMTEEGALDSEKYKAAVETEIAEWEGSFSGSSIAGVGSSGHGNATEEASNDSEADAYADELLKLV